MTRMGRQGHIEDAHQEHRRDGEVESTLAVASRMVTVANTQGLHARPVMRFVDLASQFESRVRVRKGKCIVDGKNPMEMMLLEATRGTELEILAEGKDAGEALEALAKLVASHLTAPDETGDET
jgi:phosphocarrier protein